MSRIVAIFCLLFPLVVAADDLWVPPKGTLHFAFSFTGAQWDKFLERGTSAVELPGEIDQYEFMSFAEYVPVENLSIDFQFPIVASLKKFVYLETDPMTGDITGVQLGPNGEIRDVDTNGGIGDITLGTKYVRKLGDHFSLGGRFHMKIPGSYRSGEVVNAPGDGQFDAGLSLLTGAYLPEIRSYVRFSLAFVARAGAPANQLELMLEPGINLTQTISARLIYQHIEQFGGDDIQFFGLQNYYPSNKEDSDRIGLGLGYKANETVSFFANYSRTVAGRNTANNGAYTFGIDLTY